ncbi:MAG: ectonucleotide pyrophosphatase/phosphodiesterase [Gemmatimonadota bacterium]
MNCPTLLALLALSAACQHAPAASTPGRAASERAVLLVSLDGFRADYIQRPAAVRLRALAASGVRAERMIPAFPSKTFPNHYTLVTGLRPEHHGIVANSMWDDVIGRKFTISDTAVTHDPRWWGGEPLWVTVETQGKRAASFFWVGSDIRINGRLPTWFRPYDAKVPNETRARTVLDWLAMPAGTGPAFVSTYFSDVDDAGHRYGPEAPQVDRAIARVDSLIGTLVDGIAARGLAGQVDIVVVSDHGMVSLAAERVIYLDDYLDLALVDIVDIAPVGAISPKPGYEAEAFARLKGAHPHMQVYRKGEIPGRFHFNTHPRITQLVTLADEGWTITTHALVRQNGLPKGGAHGYDNQLSSMGALFVASGPGFRQGVIVPPFQNIHVYELLARLLDVRPAPNDGSLDSTRSFLRRTP